MITSPLLHNRYAIQTSYAFILCNPLIFPIVFIMSLFLVHFISSIIREQAFYRFLFDNRPNETFSSINLPWGKSFDLGSWPNTFERSSHKETLSSVSQSKKVSLCITYSLQTSSYTSSITGIFFEHRLWAQTVSSTTSISKLFLTLFDYKMASEHYGFQIALFKHFENTCL